MTGLRDLRNPVRRPPQLRSPLSDLLTAQLEVPFELDQALSLKNFKSARRGAAGGPSGMTTEHLRPLLDSEEDCEKFWFSAPHQYAMSTRAGCESIAHLLQARTDQDHRATVLSIDGIGAFDLVSRESMLGGLSRVEGGDRVLPFVRQFYGSPSTYIWQDEEGIVHDIPQGAGGEQGDALMPALFSLGQHPAFEAVQSQLFEGETICAFLDDVYAVCCPDRVVPIFNLCQRELRIHFRIEVHLGKTQVWNRGGFEPPGCHLLTEVARHSNRVERRPHIHRGRTRSESVGDASGTQRVRGSTIESHHRRTPSASEPDSTRRGSAVRMVAIAVLRSISPQLRVEGGAPRRYS